MSTLAKSEKMVTLDRRAAGVYRWNARDEARIERNLVAFEGETFEALRFCKNRDGRHNRVHLVIREAEFVHLFRSAAEKGVFSETTLQQFRDVVEHVLNKGVSDQGDRGDPFLQVIGIGEDGRLAQGIDEELYGEEPA